MKPSEINEELDHARKNPKKYFLALLFMVALLLIVFYGNKFVSGEFTSECESPVYKTKVSVSCGEQEYKSGTASQCGVAQYKKCRSGPGCGWQKLGGVLDVGKARANECRSSSCGVESYNTCKHKDFGVAAYKSCSHIDHGLERCEDVPPWKFWES